jgi:hypothetical protein
MMAREKDRGRDWFSRRGRDSSQNQEMEMEFPLVV